MYNNSVAPIKGDDGENYRYRQKTVCEEGMEKHKAGIYEKCIKRFFDLLCSLLVVILFCWLYAIVAILVRVKLGKPILFTQDRPGKDGKIFKLYKFRTMTDAKDADGNLLPDDVRLTKFGKMLRATSLDELPEMFNIIKGDMSLVGPRPLLVQYLDLYNEEQKHRHDVTPGLTGYAQVHGRNAITWEQKFEMDVWYTRNLSFWVDLKILFDTVRVVLSRKGVSGENVSTVTYFTGTKKEGED